MTMATMTKRAYTRPRDPTFLAALLLLGVIILLTLRFSGTSQRDGIIYRTIEDLSSGTFDVIFVLGGGVPSSLYEPPNYVQQRCDDAVALRGATKTPIVTLSAGTAHLPQLLTKDGSPVWESTSSAAYLQQKHGVSENVFLETTSYDTIGNAYFARTTHTDIVGWRKLLIITNEVRDVRAPFVL